MIHKTSVQGPSSRRLRIYACDPSLGLQIQTAGINEITVKVPWEKDSLTGQSSLGLGPVGEYLEVVDFDPASGMFYPPVNLNDPDLLAEDGLAPSEGNPQFHQQMVYAVAMTTIDHFERALGRVALWATHKGNSKNRKFVRRLRIYPHALRDQNAYYSPQKKSILFGYFPVRIKDARNTPGTIVFSCLSHDIIAHEVTHALLDGVHPRFNEPTNPDVHAFHEAFADIVALFQHFSYTGVLKDQISRTRGDLEGENTLAQLAQQFGQATGRGGALRDALGSYDPDAGKWVRRVPDAQVLEKVMEPHARGAILVAAVFGAFLLVYRSRTVDLYRIATHGTGVLPEGDIHPDLAERLADEARRASQYILQMCIRALDYCPPVDITFGDYLRAMISADLDVNGETDLYRIAVIESFRQWGIYPHGIRSMSVESLQWETGEDAMADGAGAATRAPDAEIKTRLQNVQNDFRNLLQETQQPSGLDEEEDEEEDGTSQRSQTAVKVEPWNLESDRLTVWQKMEDSRWALWRWLVKGQGRKYAKAFGLVLEDFEAPPTVYRSKDESPSVEVHSVRTALRRTARGALITDLVVEITQRRRGYFDKDEQEQADKRTTPFPRSQDGDFKYRTGCTILIDPSTMTVRRVIRTAGTITNEEELKRVRRFLTGEVVPTGNAFDSSRPLSLHAQRGSESHEPFALLHRQAED